VIRQSIAICYVPLSFLSKFHCDLPARIPLLKPGEPV
jgi:hypothetical protein